jgi:HPt (histidine-containing phosphotransfer) domain-containing protein
MPSPELEFKTTATSNLQSVDLSYLETVQLLCKPGGPDIVQKVIGIFLEHLPATLDLLDHSLNDGDITEISLAAHKLKSSSTNVGAHRLIQLLQQLEFYDDKIEQQPRQYLFERVKEECTVVNALLKNVLKTRQSGSASQAH